MAKGEAGKKVVRYMLRIVIILLLLSAIIVLVINIRDSLIKTYYDLSGESQNLETNIEHSAVIPGVDFEEQVGDPLFSPIYLPEGEDVNLSVISMWVRVDRTALWGGNEYPLRIRMYNITESWPDEDPENDVPPIVPVGDPFDDPNGCDYFSENLTADGEYYLNFTANHITLNHSKTTDGTFYMAIQANDLSDYDSLEIAVKPTVGEQAAWHQSEIMPYSQSDTMFNCTFNTELGTETETEPSVTPVVDDDDDDDDDDSGTGSWIDIFWDFVQDNISAVMAFIGVLAAAAVTGIFQLIKTKREQMAHMQDGQRRTVVDKVKRPFQKDFWIE